MKTLSSPLQLPRKLNVYQVRCPVLLMKKQLTKMLNQKRKHPPTFFPYSVMLIIFSPAASRIFIPNQEQFNNYLCDCRQGDV